MARRHSGSPSGSEHRVLPDAQDRIDPSRTAMVQIDGPDGFRMWVNGELAQTATPPPPASPSQSELTPRPPGAANGAEANTDAKADDDKEEPAVPEINDATR